jgi:hypothetical protein
MGNIRINFAEKRLLNHLQLGGQPGDRVGLEVINKFALTIWTDESVAPVFRRHGVTTDELAALILAVIDATMPCPWTKVGGGPMLIPTGWFMEPHRIENLLLEVSRENPRGRDRWRELLNEKAIALAEMTRDVHDAHYGPANVQIENKGGLSSSHGCLGVLVLGLLGLSRLLCAWTSR